MLARSGTYRGDVMAYLLVALGGALGSVARYWATLAVTAALGPRYPWATLGINVLGSFVIALTAALGTGRLPLSAETRLFIMVGICGGFTTFSSFSLQSLQLLQDGEFPAALAYMLGSVLLCVLASWAGMALGR